MKIVRFISIGGLLTSLAVIIQSAPVFLPVIGLALSPFSTLPIAIAAVFNVYLGISVLISSTLILLIVSPQEAMIFLFTTGLLGIVLGALLYRKGTFVTIMATAISLSSGILMLTYVIAIPSFGEIVCSIAFPYILIIFFLFSLAYSSIWYICFKRFSKRLLKTKFIQR